MLVLCPKVIAFFFCIVTHPTLHLAALAIRHNAVLVRFDAGFKLYQAIQLQLL